MKAIVILIIASILALIPSAILAFAPAYTYRNGRRVTTNNASQLYFFGNSKKGSETTDAKKKVVKKKAAVPAKKKAQAKVASNREPAWKGFARIVVTGSPDGVSLLGKPQYNWVTGKPMTRPGAHDWSASYKKRDESKGKK